MLHLQIINRLCYNVFVLDRPLKYDFISANGRGYKKDKVCWIVIKKITML